MWQRTTPNFPCVGSGPTVLTQQWRAILTETLRGRIWLWWTKIHRKSAGVTYGRAAQYPVLTQKQRIQYDGGG